MFRKTKITNPVAARTLKSRTKEKVLAREEFELLEPTQEQSFDGSSQEQALSDVLEIDDLSRNEQHTYLMSSGRTVLVALTRSQMLVVDDADVLVADPWCDVDRASWDPETRVIQVVFATEEDPLFLRVPEKFPMEFLSLLRDRVDSSVVIAETVALTSADSVRIAVRRDVDGSLFVQALGDPGLDLGHPLVRKKIDPVIARLRDVSGAR